MKVTIIVITKCQNLASAKTRLDKRNEVEKTCFKIFVRHYQSPMPWPLSRIIVNANLPEGKIIKKPICHAGVSVTTTISLVELNLQTAHIT